MKHIVRYWLLAFPLFLFSQLKSPSEFLGHDLGSAFTRHHKVVDYYEYLAQAVPERIQLLEYGTTYEGRPLLLAYVSTKENMSDLENIRARHIESAQGGPVPDKAIVWLSYNVHGNESVSTEASMQTVYDLLTSKSGYLEDTVVIIDPCINPDGRDRYVNWYNQHKNADYNVDPNAMEHHEGWWSGRSNHYMFDLNRDWAWLTQKESRQRLKQFNQWLPHIHVDFHEQGVDSPYYFAPAAEPFHEVVTPFQREFQKTIGKNHAAHFDAKGWFYFTKERFDLLYPSYGDTYPTYNGGIGMTYEQGGSGRAGLGIITGIGDTLTLKDRIAHHYTTGISTIEVASTNVARLNTEFARFYTDKKFTYKNYLLEGHEDKLRSLASLLRQHGISYGYGSHGTARGFDYVTGQAGSTKVGPKTMIVPANQTKGTLVKVLFEPQAKLSDSLTYDITAWSLPYAHGLKALATEHDVDQLPADQEETPPSNIAHVNGTNYAYVSHWNSLADAKFLAQLLKEGIRVRMAHKPFTLDDKTHGRGSLIITLADNKNLPDFPGTLKKVLKAHPHKQLEVVSTGLVDSGRDFGSRDVERIPETKIAVLAGEPTSTLRFGEIWHFFEQQLQYPVTALDQSYFSRVDLSQYQVLILPDGRGYRAFLEDHIMKKITAWVKSGGTLIAMGGPLEVLAQNKEYKLWDKKETKDSIPNMDAYELSERERIKDAITGAIFKTTVDPTHPLAYGYGDTYFTLKLGNSAFDNLDGGTAVYLAEGQNVPVSGFAGSNARKAIDRTLVFGSQPLGRGHVVYMVDNPLFRGFWENGKLFFANALFMLH